MPGRYLTHDAVLRERIRPDSLLVELSKLQHVLDIFLGEIICLGKLCDGPLWDHLDSSKRSQDVVC